MNRITTDEAKWWPPKPLVLCNRVYHWTCWNTTLSDIVYVRGMLQLIVWDDRNQRELVVKDSMWQGANPPIQAGDKVDVFGIGERAVQGNQYSFVAIACYSRGVYAHLNCWRASINWADAFRHFGTRNKRDARHVLSSYYTGVMEVLFRASGDTGYQLAAKAEREAQFFLRAWTFE